MSWILPQTPKRGGGADAAAGTTDGLRTQAAAAASFAARGMEVMELSDLDSPGTEVFYCSLCDVLYAVPAPSRCCPWCGEADGLCRVGRGEVDGCARVDAREDFLRYVLEEGVAWPLSE